MKASLRVIATSVVIALAPAAAQAQTQWVYNNGWARNHVQIGVVAEEWIEKIDKATEGRVKIRHVPDGALLKTDATLEGIARGVAQCGAIQPAFTPSLLPISSTLVGVLDVDLGNKLDLEGVTRITKKLYDEFAEFRAEFDAHGVRPLIFSPTAPYAIFSRKPTVTLDDVKGQKIRAFGTTLPKFQTAMGATPVAMAFGEMYTSLQTGVIDAALTDPPSAVAARIYEVTKNVLTTGPDQGAGMAATTILHICRKDALEKLSEADRASIFRISNEMNMRGVEIMKKAVADAHDTLKKAGVKLNHMSAAEVDSLTKITPYFDESAKELDKQGLPGTKIFARYRELAKEYLAGNLKD